MSEKTKTVESAEQQAPASSQASTELTINDLQLLKQIIEVASQRGSFKPGEMVNVGSVYNKLEVFLTAVAQQTQSADKGE